MNSFQKQLQDLVTKWLMKGDDPGSMRDTLIEYAGDCGRMADMKAQHELSKQDIAQENTNGTS